LGYISSQTHLSCSNKLNNAPEALLEDLEKPILYVDVTHTWGSDLQTGIQRVVRQIVASWYQLDTKIALIIFEGDEYKVLPVSEIARFGELYSERIPKTPSTKTFIFQISKKIFFKFKKFIPRRAARILLKSLPLKSIQNSTSKIWVPKSTVSLNPTNANILLLELVLHPGRIAYLKRIALNNGAKLSYFSYDCNPIIAPQYWPEGLGDDFLNYISLVEYSKCVWSISRTAQDDIKRFSKADQRKISFEFKWLPPTIFPECSHPDEIFSDLENRNYILMVASYVPSKNHLGFLDSLKLLHSKNISIPEVYLTGGGSWIGSVIDNKILELADVGIQINKYEAIQNCCVRRLYENSLFLVLPSFLEGFGLPIVESLSFGKPVVTSNSMSMGELLSLPGTVGFSHEIQSNLSTVLERLLTEPELLKNLTFEAEMNRKNLGTWIEYATSLYDFVMTEGC
jgi:glycosyltransferase involved in cell wall biosynthesis